MDVLAVSKTKVRHVYECKTCPAQVRDLQLLRCCWTQHCLQAEFVRSAGSAHRGLLSSEELNTCHNPLLIQNLQPGRTVRPNIAIFTPNHPSILTRHQHTQVRYKGAVQVRPTGDWKIHHAHPDVNGILTEPHLKSPHQGEWICEVLTSNQLPVGNFTAITAEIRDNGQIKENALNG